MPPKMPIQDFSLSLSGQEYHDFFNFMRELYTKCIDHLYATNTMREDFVLQVFLELKASERIKLKVAFGVQETLKAYAQAKKQGNVPKEVLLSWVEEAITDMKSSAQN